MDDLAQQHDDANLEALRAILADANAVVLTSDDFDGNPPAQRVQTYLDAIDEHDRNSGGIRYGDTVHGLNDIELTRTDLRDVMRELHEHIVVLCDIDQALDIDEAQRPVGAPDSLAAIRAIMGRRS